jgi:hypothetical protein
MTSGVQNLPVEQLPHLYISGMNVSVASNTVIALAPGQCRDQNDAIDMEYDFPLYLNSAVNGAGGLDSGTLAASTNYLIWAIADSKNKLPNSGLISLQSNVAPLLPYGYDSMRLIGAVSTNGSTHFTSASVLNAVNYKGYYIQPAVSVLSGGNATSFTAIDLSSAIPTTTDPFVVALATVTFIPAAVGDTVVFRPTGSSATSNLPTITGIAAGVAQTQNIVLNCGVGSSKPEVDYEVTVSGDAVSVSVYGYYVTLS